MAYSRDVEFDEPETNEGPYPGMNRISGAKSPGRDTRQIGAQLSQNREELLKLREMVGLLHDRIAPVLGPERAERSPGSSDDAPECSDIARELDDHRSLIRVVQMQVAGLLDRVEI